MADVPMQSSDLGRVTEPDVMTHVKRLYKLLGVTSDNIDEVMNKNILMRLAELEEDIRVDWTGTKAEYLEAKGNGTITPEMYCYITDDDDFDPMNPEA